VWEEAFSVPAGGAQGLRCEYAWHVGMIVMYAQARLCRGQGGLQTRYVSEEETWLCRNNMSIHGYSRHVCYQNTADWKE
jgi:hypothetical protein